MKTPLKTILIIALIAFSAFAATVYSSCNRDLCKTIVCANGGICNGGSCTCPLGFDGTNCEDTARNKFLGNWTVFEKGSTTQAAQYPISIQPGALINDVVIINFFNYFTVPINASIVNDTIIIPNQQYQGKVIFGLGYIYTSTTYTQFGSINMEYEVIDTATQVVDDFGYYTNIDGSAASSWNK